MDISVIIPTYNRLEFTKKAIKSVLNQSFSAKEIIVVNDGGEDINILKDLHPSIKLIAYQENKGVSYARNIGIKNSSYKWIAFLDSDDIWLEDKLQEQVSFHKKNKKILLSQTQEIWIKNNKIINQPSFNTKYDGAIFAKSIHRCIITTSSLLIHKSIFDDIGLFDESLKICEDYDMWLRITNKYNIALINIPLIKKYAGHNGQLSFSTWGIDRFRIIALEKHLNNQKYHKEIQELLIQKYTILINGATKRNNKEIQEFYQKKLNHIK
jgi:glycosyltransferase involved in cell wall biosynthesis